MADGAPLLAIDAIAKSYAGKVAVQPTSLDVAAGAFVAVLGGSGSGKTTLLKMIMGLIVPDSGAALFDGAAMAGAEARRHVGYVFQGVGLFPHLTVAENIAITPRLLGWSEVDQAARVRELLDLVALPQAYAARAPATLSGGERQRVGVARALAARPRLMLMDEPFGALDPLTRTRLGEDYLALHKSLGLTTLMVTHDVLEAALLADDVIVMRAGAMVARLMPAHLLNDPPDAVRELTESTRRQIARAQALMGASHG